MDQQELELLQIKEENERIWASQDGEQLNVKKETDNTRFPVTVVDMKSEEDEEKPLFSQLHQQQTEDRDLLSSSSGDQIKAEIKVEDCWTAESSRNPDLNTQGGSSNYSKTKHSEDDDDDFRLPRFRSIYPLFPVRQQPRSGSVDKAVRELQQQQLMNSGKKSSSLRNIWSKKLEGSRSSNSGRTQQRKRHQMMDDVFQPRLVLPADVKEEAPEEQSPDVDQQEPEPLQIKEEQEELWTSQEGEQLTVKEETDTRFPLTAAPIKNVKEEASEEQSPDMDQQELELLHTREESERIWASQDGEQLNVKKETDDTRFRLTVLHMKSEEDEEKPLLSQLHQQQTEDRDLPRSISTDQIKAEIKEEDCGTAESSRNPDLNTDGGTFDYSKTKDCEDDEEDDDVKHHESELKHLSDSETEDGRDD
ncbi:golgin subfamily A member 6-like protein 7 [Girardinichthys multiradiatus]|uniref:golgin subfamily A member 6-like protein 7 n=1 Tax=Girardinichthys multiradiatus TaxID=208333 RepID=UPI001FAC31A1|nr:golgin subfamily A member 6-like protein 7 [Girardinichthys multiradiatus]